MSKHPLKVTPFQAGLVLGLGAALVQAYFKVIPPMANGFCMVCHPKDLFNWIADHVFNLNWGYSMASTRLPLLTVVGVLLGALVAAYQHGELHGRPARQPLSNFANGFLMINFGLVLGACPIRIVLHSAYGSYLAWAGWACIVLGVFLATRFQRWNAGRSIDHRKMT